MLSGELHQAGGYARVGVSPLAQGTSDAHTVLAANALKYCVGLWVLSWLADDLQVANGQCVISVLARTGGGWP